MMGCKLGRRQVVERTVRSYLVVIAAPGGDENTRLGEVGESPLGDRLGVRSHRIGASSNLSDDNGSGGSVMLPLLPPLEGDPEDAREQRNDGDVVGKVTTDELACRSGLPGCCVDDLSRDGHFAGCGLLDDPECDDCDGGQNPRNEEIGRACHETCLLLIEVRPPVDTDWRGKGDDPDKEGVDKRGPVRAGICGFDVSCRDYAWGNTSGHGHVDYGCDIVLGHGAEPGELRVRFHTPLDLPQHQ